MEDPQSFTCADIEATDVALHILLAAWHAAGSVGGADDDNVFGDNRSGMQPDFAGDEIDFLIVIEFQIDAAVSSEAWYGHSCLRIQSDETIAGRDIKNAFLAPIRPVREAAA